jgi:hypothetical protein
LDDRAIKPRNPIFIERCNMRANSRLLMASAIIAAPAVVHMDVYANSLTRLIPDLYAGLDVVSRELVGFIPSVFRNANAERAAVGQSVVYPITAQKGLFDVTPAMQIPEPSDTSVGNGTITITKSKGVEFGWTGEEQRGLNTGPGYLSVQADNFAQALRTLTNAIEFDLAVEAAANASRFYGTPGTTPFATNVGEAAQVRKILDDNGAPASGRSLIVDTSAGASLRTLQNLTRVSEAGTAMTLRDGELLNLSGISIKESAQVQQTVAGTGAASTTNNVGYAKGATAITLAAAGTGTIPAGSVITFAGDTNKYLVVSGDADVSNGGAITIAAPGLRVAIPAAATAITVVGKGTANIAFSQNALHLVARAPALPQEGDAAIDRMLITDPRSGMVFEVAIYAGYRKIRAEVTQAWGVKAVKQEHIAGLFG